MLFTEPNNFKQLNNRSDDLISFLPVAKEINSLATGGHRLNPVNYLLIRDDEDEDITEKRIEKFVEKNYLGSAIRLQRTKQFSGQLDVDNKTLPGLNNNELWSKFLVNVNRKGDSLKNFVIDIFEKALINKTVFIQVEMDKLTVPNGLNIAQVEQFLKTKERLPYYVVLDLQNILSYSETADGVDWIKYKRIISIESPFDKTKYNLQFILVDNQHITTWLYEDVILDSYNNIISIFDQSLNRGKGGYKNFIPEKEFTTPKSIEHLRGVCPVLKYDLNEKMWMANEVYRAQRVIYGLQMNLLHTAANAGFVQKWGKPYTANSSGASGTSYAPISKELQGQILKEIAENLGDESIVLMDLFKFEELTGTSVDMQLKIIDDLKKYIFTTIAYNLDNIESTSNQDQSGKAKEIDLSLENEALKTHGASLITLTRNLLKQSSRCFGFKDPTVLDQIVVSGMNKFNLKPLEDALGILERLVLIPKELISQELMEEVIGQFSGVLLDSYSYERRQEIQIACNKAIEKYYSLPSLPLATTPVN